MRAVLFDSGGVLIGPVGGRWNPRFDFEQTVRRRSPGLADADFAAAISVGDRYLETTIATPSRDEYHTVMLDVLGVEPTVDLLAELDRRLEPATVVEPFPEVFDVLDTLRARGIRLAVVSDAWPSLPELHAGVGLGGYFEVYAISAVLGCTKPDPRMYHHASNALGLEPADCLFVDDAPALVAAAIELGYRGVALRRDGTGSPEVPTIRTLRDVPILVDG